MRVNPSKTLVLAVLCALAPAAQASSHKKPAAPTVAKSAPAKAHGKPVKSTTKPARKAPEPVKVKARHGHAEAPEPRLVKAHGRHAEPVKVPVREPAKSVARVTKPVAPPAPEPEVETAQEQIHVTHNRKIHLAPEAESVPAGDATEPRKATAADFTSIDIPVAPVAKPALTGISHPDTDDERGPRSTPAVAQPMALIAPLRMTPPVAQPTVTVRKTEVKLLPAPPTPVKVAEKPVAPEPLPVIVPVLYDNRGRLIVPPALKGSHEILLHQNEMADRDGLDRVQDDEDLERMRAAHLLVALPVGAGLEVDERLPANRRYARPWTVAFLGALAKAHYARFHSPLQVNSAVRTVEFQVRLMRTNGNAAPAEGETASPHLTGQAVDLAKHGLSLTEIAWLRGYLLPLVQAGKVDVEEEFQQACFHVSVYKKYVPQAEPKRNIVAKRSVGVLAVALP